MGLQTHERRDCCLQESAIDVANGTVTIEDKSGLLPEMLDTWLL